MRLKMVGDNNNSNNNNNNNQLSEQLNDIETLLISVKKDLAAYRVDLAQNIVFTLFTLLMVVLVGVVLSSRIDALEAKLDRHMDMDWTTAHGRFYNNGSDAFNVMGARTPAWPTEE